MIGMMTFMIGQLNAQVTIGSNEPPRQAALLDLKSKTTDADNVTSDKGGLLLPRVKLEKEETLEPFIKTTDSEWVNDATTKVKSTHTGLIVYNLNKDKPFVEGLYIWNGQKWTMLNRQSPWQVSATSDVATANYQDIYQMGTVSIGNSAETDPSAILRVDATNKGVLLPRVKLTGRKDQETIKNPTAGLLVYNEGTTTFPIIGYLFWNGEEWRAINTTTTISPNAILSCGEVRLDPEQVIQGGVAISTGTTMRIPYTQGNGGLYNGVVIESVGNPNVKATILSGQFESGSGYINFTVTGTPTSDQTSPKGITFDLTPFYTANPSLTVGCKSVVVGEEFKAEIARAAVIDNLKYTEDGGVPAYATQITTPDGKFSIRAVIVSRDYKLAAQHFGYNGIYGINLQIRNNTDKDVIIAGQFNYTWTLTGGNGANYLGLQPGLWSGDTKQIVINQSRVYWANYVSNGGGTGYPETTVAPLNEDHANSKTNSAVFINWGDPGVYADGIPERRTYSWIINDGGATKTAYILTFSSSALKPMDFATKVTCPNGVCVGTKMFMMIDQIDAP